jgi:NADH dehydrogenase
VVNLVGIAYQRGHQKFETIQARAPGMIADAARAERATRLVQVSAIGADAQSASRYARSKALGEQAARAAVPDATILRPSLLIGPEDDFFNRFAAMARLSPVLPLIGGGRTRFQPAVVWDVAEAVRRALAREDAAGRTFELGGPGLYTFRELMQLMLRETGRRRILLPLPFALASVLSFGAQLLPKPALTPDQVELLKHDNVVAAGVPGFAALGIVPDAIEAVLPTYLWRFRRAGQYTREIRDSLIAATTPQKS